MRVFPVHPSNTTAYVKEAANVRVNIFRVQELSFRDGDNEGNDRIGFKSCLDGNALRLWEDVLWPVR